MIGAIVIALGAIVLLPRGLRDSAERGDDVAITLTALCRSLRAAEAGRFETARRAFVDEAHDGLHRMAAALGDVDRGLEANLLESKAAVEVFAQGFTPAAVAPLQQLATDAGRAARTLKPGATQPC